MHQPLRTTVRTTASLLAVVLLSTACSADDTTATSPDPTPTASEASETSEPPALAWPGLDVGAELDPADFLPGSVGFAWQIDGAVLLTGTTGLPAGHLVGFTIDRDRSDALAAPVLTDADGRSHGLSGLGLTELVPDAVVPLFDGWTLILGDARAAVFGQDAEQHAVIEGGLDDLWVSATGTVVGNLDGSTFDIEQDATAELLATCRVADRHTVDDPLLVCFDDTQLGGGSTGVAAPVDGAHFGWVTVGTTGNEFIATVRAGGDRGGVLSGTRTDGSVDAGLVTVLGNGAALSFRQSGKAWLADFDAGALVEFDPSDGSIVVLREMPGVTDAMIWTR